MQKKASSWNVTFAKKKSELPDITSYYFTLPEGFSYTAGQYVQLTLPHDHPDEQGTTRYFTLSSAPNEQHLVITTRLSSSTFKQTLNRLQVGDIVSLFGPIGRFVIDEV